MRPRPCPSFASRSVDTVQRLTIVVVIAATIIELGAAVGIIHTMLSYAMAQRGLALWKVSDTLLTSPLLFFGITLFFASLNSAIASVVWRHARGIADLGVVPLVVMSGLVVGAMAAAFGVRAVGKLY
jgi:hypothetical protein